MRKYLALILLLLPGSMLIGQGVIVDQPKMLYSNERTIGAMLNSNGISLEYRFAKHINARNDRVFDISLDYVKHPKEYRSAAAYNFYSNRFVYGKKNLFWELQGEIGNQHELFRKYDFSSISIRYYYTGGLSISFQKPIYYDIISFNSLGERESIEQKKFDPAIHFYNYGGTSPFLKGFDELKVVPGVTVKTGFSFEYSEREPIVHAVDAGIAFTIYPSNIEIMATEEKQFFFFKLYAGYRFGTLIDISEGSRAKSRKERRMERKEATRRAQDATRRSQMEMMMNR